ncbi:unnamed protein product, partial [Ectocarpus sp. 12 AP-2014]
PPILGRSKKDTTTGHVETPPRPTKRNQRKRALPLDAPRLGRKALRWFQPCAPPPYDFQTPHGRICAGSAVVHQPPPPSRLSGYWVWPPAQNGRLLRTGKIPPSRRTIIKNHLVRIFPREIPEKVSGIIAARFRNHEEERRSRVF